MEDLERRVIKSNLPKLIRDTHCNTTLLAILLAQEIISDEERIHIGVIPNPMDKADYLYKIIVTRKNAYEDFLKACNEVKQSGVVHIIRTGEHELKLSDGLKECTISDFACQSRNNISVRSFQSIAKAISAYSDVRKFKIAFEGYNIFGFRSQPENRSWLLRGTNNETFLHVAAAFGYVKLIDYVVELGLQTSAVDNIGRTPGHYIGLFSTNIVETTKTLIKHGLNVREMNGNGFTIAATVVRHGKINQYHYHHWVEYMIKNGYEDLFAQRFKGGTTCLHHAVHQLDLEGKTIGRLLLSGNVNINQSDSLGRTILHLALLYGRSLKTIKDLVKLGVDYRINDNNKEGALHFAVRGSNQEVFDFLISLKLDISQVDKLGETPLHKVLHAKNRDYFGMTKLLLCHGADLYAKTNLGHTFAHLVTLSNDVSCDDLKVWATAMIANGHGNVFKTAGFMGRTPLMTSIEKQNLDLATMKLILDSTKLDINQPDDNGNNILYLGLSFGRSLEIIKNLVHLGADWMAKGELDRGVMHYAVEGSNQEAFVYFKSLGADVNARDKNGETPLHRVTMTTSKDYLGMTQFLLENGANLHAKDYNGRNLDKFMSSHTDITDVEYQFWKIGMIELGHATFFQ